MLNQLLSSILLSCLVLTSLTCEEVFVRTASGDNVTVDIDPQASFSEVVTQIESYLYDIEPNYDSYYAVAQESNSTRERTGFRFLLDYLMGPEKKGHQTSRNYHAGVSKYQGEMISYIVISLATEDWWTLLKDKSSLEKAGDVTDDVHPLNFFAYICKDPDLTGALHSIHERKGKVWDKFYSGFSKSFNEEKANNNLPMQFIEDFANRVRYVDAKAIANYLKKGDYENFIKVLINNVPRSDKYLRYGQQ